MDYISDIKTFFEEKMILKSVTSKIIENPIHYFKNTSARLFETSLHTYTIRSHQKNIIHVHSC